MMRKYPGQDMVKASLWMHKDEFKKIAELSGDMSLNLFIMRAVRKAIAAEQEREVDEDQKGVEGSRPTNHASHPAQLLPSADVKATTHPEFIKEVVP